MTVSSSIDNNMSTGATFIDLSEAFDMVEHYLLLDKWHVICLSKHSLVSFLSPLLTSACLLTWLCITVLNNGERCPSRVLVQGLLYFLYLLMIFLKSAQTVVFIYMQMTQWSARLMCWSLRPNPHRNLTLMPLNFGSNPITYYWIRESHTACCSPPDQPIWTKIIIFHSKSWGMRLHLYKLMNLNIRASVLTHNSPSGVTLIVL